LCAIYEKKVDGDEGIWRRGGNGLRAGFIVNDDVPIENRGNPVVGAWIELVVSRCIAASGTDMSLEDHDWHLPRDHLKLDVVFV
jgi:hypothetical protein